ncbi:alpha,alpha-trehalase TreF [Chryseosolibacter indicus]|uniref:Alpha,alpha-trehalase TreF n=1 Tax=Chryseosolibacter indicus TaxID=2782351 RepID=A0ABS5VXK2_9BACT|nr:alpha,alpha-trehalase TreF [Chryseosolibacter indicus]MBT1706153.1 alpha,alpha-trehalase TreF [Chryseosolibacter indicus]
MATVGCSVKEQKQTTSVDFYTSSLFHEVQLNVIFPDSKTFVDCTPKRDLSEILTDYNQQKEKPGFELKKFVDENFDLPVRPKTTYATDTTLTMEEHLTRLWPVLTRKADHAEPRSSLIPLPYDYVVPGGRFSEIYYWDSYFTILGLKSQKRYDLIQSMVKNFAHLIDTLGFIPNGNRNYYLTRSQPPFFSLIIRELEDYDSLAADHYLDAMVKEYKFWMAGADSVKKPGDAVQHVVMLTDGTLVNRYFDKGESPRPEAYKEDYALAQKQNGDAKKLYRDIRSAAESGWDFSSRWLRDGKSLETIHTTDIIPVDLNCLLAHLEMMIAKGYTLRGDKQSASEYTKQSKDRRRAISTFCWDAETNFYYDYDFVEGKRKNVKSLAGIYPLFLQMSSADIAEKVSVTLEKEFLEPGGLITTLTDTHQQWDAPNGWAPLQWMTYKGLKNYQIDKLADNIRNRWLRQNIRVYEATGKMMEKYNVMDTTLIAGGGEYPNQDGFGWTNGVALTFAKEITYQLHNR